MEWTDVGSIGPYEWFGSASVSMSTSPSSWQGRRTVLMIQGSEPYKIQQLRATDYEWERTTHLPEGRSQFSAVWAPNCCLLSYLGDTDEEIYTADILRYDSETGDVSSHGSLPIPLGRSGRLDGHERLPDLRELLRRSIDSNLIRFDP